MDKKNQNYTIKTPLCIVGIGISAGGLETLEQLFNHISSDTGMAYVILQHLSPHYKSFMAELLTRHTAMPVRTAEHHMLLESDTVYLLPPKKLMTVSGGRLLLSDASQDSGLSLPIDLFFRSLAEDQGSRSAGIILSGYGSDGTSGIEALKDAGGLILVQDVQSAKFEGMPKSSAMTGLADYVVSPAEMGEKLKELLLSDRMDPKMKRNNRQVQGQDQDQELEQTEPKPLKLKDSASTDHDLGIIVEMLKGTTGIDFSSYKSGSVLRRIERRAGICGVKSLKSYVRYLHDHPEELSILQKDLLIGVTPFFRDPDAFEALQLTVLPQIFKQKGREKEIRIWVAGCSTGEEAYSLAIMIHQYLEQLEQYYDVKIFATDLDKDSVEFASQGVYPKRMAASVPEEILNKYFIRIQDTYHVHKDIRKMIVFVPHNVLKDPPFMNLDLITCRNMLIYLQPEMQRKVISLFHFALNASGYLFLGPSETIGKLSYMYTHLDKKWNIFRYKETSRKTRFSKLEEPKILSPIDSVMNQLVKEYLPPFIIVDDQNEVIHTSGNLGDFLKLPEGKPSHNILKMIMPGLSAALGSAIHKARKEKDEVCYRDLKITEAGYVRHIQLRVKPIVNEAGVRNLVLFFENQQESVIHPESLDSSGLRQDIRQRILDLEQELQHAEEYLQATIEELETSNEELQTSNEELIAANEEMQSTNEELQSLNEELVTVNNEHQSKIQELSELNSDLDNLLTSTKIATVFLDKQMCIRRFTPSITEDINLMDVDIGRPLAHISHQFKYGSIVRDVQRVLRTLIPIEKDIQSRRGKWYSMRVLPYWFNERFVEGIVIAFVDITELKLANESMQLMTHAIEQSPSTIFIADPKGIVEYVNPKYTESTGYTLNEVIGKPLKWLQKKPERSREIWDCVTSGRKWEGELENRTKSGDTYWERATVIPIKNEDGVIIHFLQVAENITDRKHTEEALRKSELLSAVGQLAAGIAHEIRNPLTALKGFTKLMGAQGNNSKYTEIMTDELDRIETIISELLILAKPQAVQFHEKDLVTVLQEVIVLLDTQAILNNVEILSEFELGECPVLCIDNQLKQVFINLVKNAIEAMPNGGQIQVKVSYAGDGQALIQVTDQGVGISPEKLQSLGQPFYTTKEKGTGLGLMMSFKIIENHNSTMTVSSKVGVGTTFEVRVPLARERQ